MGLGLQVTGHDEVPNHLRNRSDSVVGCGLDRRGTIDAESREGINQRDREPGEATADQQKANPADRDLTSKIRKAIVDDKTLSTYAHNVKVISQNGTVTLKGPVRSDAEMKSILAKAQDMAGADKVVNEMSVQPENVSK